MEKKRKLLLIISLISNIGILAVFKYYNFIIDNLSFLTSSLGFEQPLPYLNILLPIGLSFHTFQAMSYTIEVYRNNQKAEKHFGIYSLYVMFFPQLVAGPIERPQNVLHQFYEKHNFNYANLKSGMFLIVTGLFKKIVIADRLALIVNDVYSHPEDFKGPTLILATVFFAIQIYCDFSGYSEMALGSAKIMGFSLMENFRQPYFSKSISEFWTRWHISLSTWFKDYLYIPLGGNRVAVPRWYFNLFFVFLLSGLWHGASWTFIIWGSLHGFYLIMEIILKNPTAKLLNFLKIDMASFPLSILKSLIIFSLVSFAWIFFRAQSFNDAVYICTHLFTGYENFFSISFLKKMVTSLGQGDLLYGAFNIITGFGLIVLLGISEYYFQKKSPETFLESLPLYSRWSIYYGVLIVIILTGVYKSQEFIYFQF